MKILFVIDVQNDFVDGALGTPEAQAMIPALAEKIRNFDGKVCVTKDTHYGDYATTQEGALLPVQHCLHQTKGWNLNPKIAEALASVDGERDWENEVFKKFTFGSVAAGEFVRALSMCENVEEVVLTGICTDICVISNAMLIKAFNPEVKITVDAACCAGTTPENHDNALRAMRQCQIFIENWEG